MKSLPVFAFIVLGPVAIAAEPGVVFVDRTKPVDICGLHADTLDHIDEALVEKGGVREAAGDQKFLAYESLDFSHIWTFTRLGHPAHPAVICRALKGGESGLEVTMDFLCAGDRVACETLYGEFTALNASMKAAAAKKKPSP